MQISSINSYDNTNFKALKGVHIESKKFKTYPEEASKVLKAVSENKRFQEFCDRWDVKIGLNNRIVNYMDVTDLYFFHKATKKPGIVNAIRSLFSKYKQFYISGYGYDVKDSVNELNKAITEHGVLDGQIKYVNGVADEKIARLSERNAAKKALKAQKAADKGEAEKQKDKLNTLIDNMVDSK